jgi:hypothetical protein
MKLKDILTIAKLNIQATVKANPDNNWNNSILNKPFAYIL